MTTSKQLPNGLGAKTGRDFTRWARLVRRVTDLPYPTDNEHMNRFVTCWWSLPPLNGGCVPFPVNFFVRLVLSLCRDDSSPMRRKGWVEWENTWGGSRSWHYSGGEAVGSKIATCGNGTRPRVRSVHWVRTLPRTFLIVWLAHYVYSPRGSLVCVTKFQVLSFTQICSWNLVRLFQNSV